MSISFEIKFELPWLDMAVHKIFHVSKYWFKSILLPVFQMMLHEEKNNVESNFEHMKINAKKNEILFITEAISGSVMVSKVD